MSPSHLGLTTGISHSTAFLYFSPVGLKSKKKDKILENQLFVPLIYH